MMGSRGDGITGKKAVVAIVPQTATNSDTAITGAIVDFSNWEKNTFVIGTGTLTDTNATFAVSLEVGDDSALSDTAAAASSDLVGTLSGAGFAFGDDIETRMLGYVGKKRYGRLTITPSGNNSGAAPVCALLIQENGRLQSFNQG